MANYGAYSDEELVRIILDGDSDAYGEIIARYKNMIFGVTTHILSDDRAGAEDMAQETFIDGYFQLNRLEKPESLAPWLYGIARRKALHYAAKRRIHTDIDALADFLCTDSLSADYESSDHTSPETWMIRNETRAAVRDALQTLSEKNRIVTQLFYFEEMSVADIAARLSLSQSAVKSRLYEAREKLKGVLAHMTEQNKTTLPAGFDAAVQKKLQQIRYYYALHNGSLDGFDALLSETQTMAEELPESPAKHKALAAVYMQTYNRDKTKTDYYDKAVESAKKANNGDVIASQWIDKILDIREDYEGWIRMIDEEALPDVKAVGGDNGQGELLFWRGAANTYLKKLREARADFEASAKLCDTDNVYRACAVCGIKNIDYAVEHTDDPTMGIHIVSETLIKQDGKLFFASQPGFTNASVMWEKHKWDSLHYYISCGGRLFYDLDMKVGGTYTDKDGASLTLAAADDTADTPAGIFRNCLHVICGQDDYTADAWYEKGIGLVKAVFTKKSGESETYVLDECRIFGGEGYFPFAEKNCWRYKKTDLPPYLYQCFEYEIQWTDGIRATLSTLNYVNFRKNYLESATLDSDYYMSQCDKLCADWKISEAMDALKMAVRKNTNQQAVFAALGSMEGLSRFADYHAKGWRFCPSSVNASTILAKDGAVSYDDVGLYSFSPYRFGTRFEENRIFGAKPFRYLDRYMGKIYDEKWIPGYREIKTEEETAITFEVAEGGVIETPAGVFTDTVKLTLTAEKSGLGDSYYFDDNYRHTGCGKKEYWLAKGVGLVRFDCAWGKVLDSSLVLVSCDLPAADDSYLPVQIGNAWEYDEVNLTREGYRAKRIMRVACGMADQYVLQDNQEFVFMGTEAEYEAFKETLG